MSKPSCSSCRFWEATNDNQHRQDDEIMDAARLYGWCEKDRATKFSCQLCGSYKPKLQFQEK